MEFIVHQAAIALAALRFGVGAFRLFVTFAFDHIPADETPLAIGTHALAAGIVRLQDGKRLYLAAAATRCGLGN